MHKETDDLSRAVSARIRAWLLKAYPRNTAKLAAQAFNVSPNTTKKWLEGSPPLNRHLFAMIALWKCPFVSYVYEPVMGGQELALAELGELKQRMIRLEQATLLEEPDPVAYFGRRPMLVAPAKPA